MTYSFGIKRERSATQACLQRLRDRSSEARDLGVASAARGKLECVQLLGRRVAWRFHVCFHVGQDTGWGAIEQTMNTHVLHKKNSPIRNKSVT